MGASDPNFLGGLNRSPAQPPPMPENDWLPIEEDPEVNDGTHLYYAEIEAAGPYPIGPDGLTPVYVTTGGKIVIVEEREERVDGTLDLVGWIEIERGRLVDGGKRVMTLELRNGAMEYRILLDSAAQWIEKTAGLLYRPPAGLGRTKVSCNSGGTKIRFGYAPGENREPFTLSRDKGGNMVTIRGGGKVESVEDTPAPRAKPDSDPQFDGSFMDRLSRAGIGRGYW